MSFETIAADAASVVTPDNIAAAASVASDAVSIASSGSTVEARVAAVEDLTGKLSAFLAWAFPGHNVPTK